MKLELEKVRRAPLCMDSYKWLFHASRYHAKPSDTAAKFDPVTNSRRTVFSPYPSRSPTAKDHPTPSLKRMLPSLLTCDSPPSLLYRQVNHVISLAEPTPSPFPIGALTSDKDLWTDARSALAGRCQLGNVGG